MNMDAGLVYTQLFDVDGQLDTDLFQDVNLQDTVTTDITDSQSDKSLLNYKGDELLSNVDYNLSGSPYLQYPQSTEMNDNNHGFFYKNNNHQQTMAPSDNSTSCGFFQATDQKQAFNWFSNNPFDTAIPQNTGIFCDNSMPINIMSNDQPTISYYSLHHPLNDTGSLDGGMARSYVSLREVNSFVANADSTKHSLAQLQSTQNNLLSDDLGLNTQYQYHRNSISSSESGNEDSEDESFDSDYEIRWPSMAPTSYSTPTSAANRQKLMIKIKGPSNSLSVPTSASGLPSPYGEHQWDMLSPKVSKSVGTSKYRKSMPNIFGATKKKGKPDNKGRRGSTPTRLTLHSNKSTSSISTVHSSSSLSSLTNKLQRSMRVSDTLNDFLSGQCSDEEDDYHEHFMEESDDYYDDEFHIRAQASTSISAKTPVKKGRNVDKACNHCKRSHLRCDEMRPCRRCVATGKTGCKDVEHKPRGRPKLNKNL